MRRNPANVNEKHAARFIHSNMTNSAKNTALTLAVLGTKVHVAFAELGTDLVFASETTTSRITWGFARSTRRQGGRIQYFRQSIY